MNAPSVAHVANPAFVEFEAVLDHAAQSNATLRRAFVKRFFDFMLGQRMNVNAEGLVHDVLESVVASLAATYEANVEAPDVKGFRWGRLAAFGPTKMSMVADEPGRIRAVVTPREVELKPDTDTALVADGYVSVTRLVTPRATDPVDPSHLLDTFLARRSS